jgi:AcrR family transcriptional regulator
VDCIFHADSETCDTKGFLPYEEFNMSDQDTKNRILDRSLEHFLQFGFSKVTMNEIAEDLGMSKKTLYLYFPSKEEMLLAVMNRLHTETASKIDTFVDDQSMDFVQKLREILNVVADFHTRMNPHFLTDLYKHAPEAGKCSSEFRHDRMRSVISRLVNEGTQKGVFKKDVNEEMIALIYAGALQMILQPDIFSQLSLSVAQVHHAIGKVLFAGILTDAAREKFVIEPSAVVSAN